MKIYLIDGYNLIHRLPDLRAEMARGLEAARRRLESKCLPLQSLSDVRAVYIIYDGQGEGYQKRSSKLGVIYTSRKQSADSRILELVRSAEESGDEIIVVSDDREITWHGRGLGARACACAELESLLSKTASGTRSRPGRSSSPSALPKDGLKPSDFSKITEEYRKHLGL